MKETLATRSNIGHVYFKKVIKISVGSQASLTLSTLKEEGENKNKLTHFVFSQFLLPPFIACIER